MLKREGIKISYRPINSESCLFILEAITNGIADANIVELEHGAPDFAGLAAEGILYERPQKISNNDHDQHVGTLSEVIHKGKATCLEAAAIETALYRRAGHNATVRLIPQVDAYSKPIEWMYHAVVELPDGQVIDPTESMQGGGQAQVAGQEWWAKAGHCCGSCAMGKECEGGCGDACDCGKEGPDRHAHQPRDSSHHLHEAHETGTSDWNCVRQPRLPPAERRGEVVR